MAVPIEEIVGLELMHPERLREVVELLRKLPVSRGERAYLYTRWAGAVGIVVDRAGLARLK